MTEGKPTDPFKSLAARIKQAQTPEPSKEGLSDQERSGLSMAFRIGVEMVAALIVGLVIGFTLDTWLETKPLFIVIFFFLGAAGGILNVYRQASGIGMKAGYGSQQGDSDQADSQNTGNGSNQGPQS